MAILLLDTSTSFPFAALLMPNGEWSMTALPSAHQLGNALLPSIKNLFEKQAASLDDLRLIAVGTGPGSFNGTRVGVAFAKSLAFARTIPLKGFCSLLSFCPAELSSYAILMNGKKEQVFVLKRGENGLETEARLISVPDLEKEIADCSIVMVFPFAGSDAWAASLLSDGKERIREPHLDLTLLVQWLDQKRNSHNDEPFAEISLTYINM